MCIRDRRQAGSSPLDRRARSHRSGSTAIRAEQAEDRGNAVPGVFGRTGRALRLMHDRQSDDRGVKQQSGLTAFWNPGPFQQRPNARSDAFDERAERSSEIGLFVGGDDQAQHCLLYTSRCV